MSRSRFTRLGDHIARDKAAEVRAKAAAGDAAAIDDLSRLNGILTPDGLDDKLQDVVSQMLARAAHTLKGEGCEAPPLSGFSSAEQHGWMLLTWAKKQSFDCDSLPGRMVTVIGLCAQTLIEMDRGDARFSLGAVLGYGIAQKYFLAFREFADGPALARERAGANGRSEGGKSAAAARAENEKRDQARKEFQAKKALDPKLTKRRFAKTFAKQHKLEFETVRDWLKEPRK